MNKILQYPKQMLYFALKLLALITNTKYSAPPSPKYSTQNLGDILLGKPVLSNPFPPPKGLRWISLRGGVTPTT